LKSLNFQRFSTVLRLYHKDAAAENCSRVNKLTRGNHVARLFSTRDLAELLGVETWRVRRIFEDGTLPEPSRFAGRRVIAPELVPLIVQALRDRGWLDHQAQEVVQR
jgi:hypothetical protein